MPRLVPFADQLALPLIGAPMFIASYPELVVAQCQAGVLGTFPSLNSRSVDMLDEWLARIAAATAPYILVPVPNLTGYKYAQADYRQDLRELVLDAVSKKAGVDIEDLIEVEHAFYPQDFVSRYNIKNGATFGLAHTLMQSAFFRPPNHNPSEKNIYFVGASTQPGGGLPVVIAGSSIVADLIGPSTH